MEIHISITDYNRIEKVLAGAGVPHDKVKTHMETYSIAPVVSPAHVASAYEKQKEALQNVQ